MNNASRAKKIIISLLRLLLNIARFTELLPSPDEPRLSSRLQPFCFPHSVRLTCPYQQLRRKRGDTSDIKSGRIAAKKSGGADYGSPRLQYGV